MRIVDSQSGRLDEDSWDQLVATDTQGHLLQTWAWGDLKAAFGWEAVRVAVARDGVLCMGAQILYRRLGPLTIGYIPKGPVLPDRDTEDVAQLWEAIDALSHQRRAVLLKVEPEWRDDEPEHHEWLRKHSFVPSPETVQPRRTIIVNLSSDEDDILARMKSKWRYNVRLAARRGVTVQSTGLEGLAAFYRLMRVTGERNDFGIHTLAYYRRALELFEHKGRVQLLMASYEDQPLAGIMAFAFNRQAWYMYGASGNAHRELMPNHLLQWRAMQWAKQRGCTQYDLWGIADVDPDSATADLTGVQRFKAGFGGETVRYVGAYDRVYRRIPYWAISQLWAWRRSRTSDGE